MMVVLRPDQHTELVLKLRLDEGAVHIAAQCESGDIRQLSSNWNELQKSLASQGVRLGELESKTTPTGGGGHNGFHESAAEHRHGREAREEFAPEHPASHARRPQSGSRSARPAASRAARWEAWG
jgi:hypothetical protein